MIKSLFERLKSADYTALAKAITLVESIHPVKKLQARELLTLVLKEQNKIKNDPKTLGLRIGLSGPPGAGKSTFIEAMGKHLTGQGLKIAVLAVDPSSSNSGGSLLGDKTRMPELARDEMAFIRPSPTGGHLGGVTRSTNEAIALCQCAGFDVVFVETVGVGQSEYKVADMVDVFVLLLAPAGGDELQGIKKGIVELADIVVISKADGDLLPAARRIQAEYTSALKFVRKKSSSWVTKVLRVSSKKREGISELWSVLNNFHQTKLASGELRVNRSNQQLAWLNNHLEYQLMESFYKHPIVSKDIEIYKEQIREGLIAPGTAADLLIEKFFHEQFKNSEIPLKGHFFE